MISYTFHLLRWAISYPAHSIFHCLPGAIFYHFISCPGAFHTLLIAFFITCQVQFIYPFHSLPWAISYPPCWIFHCLPGAIFHPFYSLPWAILYPPHCIFHCLPGAIFHPFQSLPCTISFLAQGHSIPILLDFSLPARCDFLSISFLSLGHLIPTLSHFSLSATLHFSLPPLCNFLSISFSPFGAHYFPWLPHCFQGPNMEMHAFPPLHIPPKGNHS